MAAAGLDPPNRLVDYLVVVREGVTGLVEQFPAVEHEDFPVPPQVSMFCLPDADESYTYGSSVDSSDSDSDGEAARSQQTAVEHAVGHISSDSEEGGSGSARARPAQRARARSDTPASSGMLSRSSSALSSVARRNRHLPPYEGPKPEFFTFVLTAATGQRSFGACVSFCEPVSVGTRADSRLNDHEESDPGSMRYRGRRAVVCLLSHWPFFSLFKDYLKELYNTYIDRKGSHSRGVNLPMERYIFAFVVEAPLPPPDMRVEYPLLGNSLVYARPATRRLPGLDPMCMATLFSCLDVNNIMSAISFLLTEQRVVLYSAHKARLAAVAEGLLSLLFPFCWQHIYIPLLPRKLLEYAQAPVPFLMGIDTACLARAEIVDALPSSAVCDLDNNKVVSPIEDTAIGNQSDGTVPGLPVTVRRQLERRIRSVAPRPRVAQVSSFERAAPESTDAYGAYDGSSESEDGDTVPHQADPYSIQQSCVELDMNHTAISTPRPVLSRMQRSVGGELHAGRPRTPSGDTMLEVDGAVSTPPRQQPSHRTPKVGAEPFDWVDIVRCAFFDAMLSVLDWKSLLAIDSTDEAAMSEFVRDSPDSYRRFIAPFVETLVFQSFWGDASAPEPDEEVQLFHSALRAWTEAKTATGSAVSPQRRRRREKTDRVSRFLRFSRKQSSVDDEPDEKALLAAVDAEPVFDEAFWKVKDIVIGDKGNATLRALMPAVFGTMPGSSVQASEVVSAAGAGTDDAAASGQTTGEVREAVVFPDDSVVSPVGRMPYMPRLRSDLLPTSRSGVALRRTRAASVSGSEVDGSGRQHRRSSSGQITSLVMQDRLHATLGRIIDSASPGHVRHRSRTSSFDSGDRLALRRSESASSDGSRDSNASSLSASPVKPGMLHFSSLEDNPGKVATSSDVSSSDHVGDDRPPGLPPRTTPSRRKTTVGFSSSSVDVRVIEAHRKHATVQAAALSAARKEVAMLKSRVEDSEQGCVELLAELNEERVSAVSLQHETERLRHRVQELEGGILPRLEKQLTQEKAKNEDIAAKLGASSAESDQLQEQLSDSNAALFRAQKLNVQLLGQLETLKASKAPDSPGRPPSDSRLTLLERRSQSVTARQASGPAPLAVSVSHDSSDDDESEASVTNVRSTDQLFPETRPRVGSEDDFETEADGKVTKLKRRIRHLGSRLDHERVARKRLAGAVRDLRDAVEDAVGELPDSASVASSDATESLVDIALSPQDLHNRLESLALRLRSLGSQAAARDEQLQQVASLSGDRFHHDRLAAPLSLTPRVASVDQLDRSASLGNLGSLTASQRKPITKISGYSQRRDWHVAKQQRAPPKQTASDHKVTARKDIDAWQADRVRDALMASTVATLYLEATAQVESLLLATHKLVGFDATLAYRAARRSGPASPPRPTLAATPRTRSAAQLGAPGRSRVSPTRARVLSRTSDLVGLKPASGGTVPVVPPSPRRGMRHMASFEARLQAGQTESVARTGSGTIVQWSQIPAATSHPEPPVAARSPPGKAKTVRRKPPAQPQQSAASGYARRAALRKGHGGKV